MTGEIIQGLMDELKAFCTSLSSPGTATATVVNNLTNGVVTITHVGAANDTDIIRFGSLILGQTSVTTPYTTTTLEATALKNAINALTGTTGFSATSTGAAITITYPTTTRAALTFSSEISGYGRGSTVLMNTDFNPQDMPAHTMPCVVLDVQDDGDGMQYIGGITQVSFDVSMACYHYEPNAFGLTDASYSTQLLNFCDKIRWHFCEQVVNKYLNTGYKNLLNNSNFRLVYKGISKPTALENDAITKGYQVNFKSICLDDGASLTSQSSALTEHVTLVPPVKYLT